MPALKPPPRHPAVNLTADKEICPRCAGRYLNPNTLHCIACSADFTAEGLAHWRALPPSEALRI